MNVTIIQGMYSRMDAPLIAAIQTIVNNMLSSVAGILTIAVTLYVGITGLMIMLGAPNSEPIWTLVKRCATAIAVAGFLQAATYNQYVTQFVMHDMPASISSSVTGSEQVGATGFDHVWNQAFAAGLIVWKGAGWNIGLMVVVGLYWFIAAIAIGYSFMMWLATHVFLGMFTIAGPLVILGYLFGMTKTLLERWVGAILSLFFLQLFIAALLSVILVTEGEMLAAIAATSDNPFEQLQGLFGCVLLFLVAYDMIKQAPGYAVALAGGIYFHANAIGTATFGAAIRATQSVRGAAANAGVAAQRRMNARAYPAGRSLSGATP